MVQARSRVFKRRKQKPDIVWQPTLSVVNGRVLISEVFSRGAKPVSLRRLSSKFQNPRKGVSLSVTSKKNEIRFVVVGNRELVHNPDVFSGLFKKGEKILSIHTEQWFSTRNLALLETVIRKKLPALLKSNGYSGVYFDSPNPKVISLAMRFGFVEVPIPRRAKARIARIYNLGIAKFGFPAKYAGLSGRRLVLKF